MNKALIIYHSKTGTTKKLGVEIAELCNQNGLEAKVISIEEFTKKDLDKADNLFLGCWTQGHLIFNQHPAKEWVEFAKELPVIFNKKIVLFTTYKVATGSMFRKMKEQLTYDLDCLKLELKSRNGRLRTDDLLSLKREITH
jgi:flavodoxin